MSFNDLKIAQTNYREKRIALEEARKNCPWWPSYMAILRQLNTRQEEHVRKQYQNSEIRINMKIIASTKKEHEAEEEALSQLNHILQQLKIETTYDPCYHKR